LPFVPCEPLSSLLPFLMAVVVKFFLFCGRVHMSSLYGSMAVYFLSSFPDSFLRFFFLVAQPLPLNQIEISPNPCVAPHHRSGASLRKRSVPGRHLSSPFTKYDLTCLTRYLFFQHLSILYCASLIVVAFFGPPAPPDPNLGRLPPDSPLFAR